MEATDSRRPPSIRWTLHRDRAGAFERTRGSFLRGAADALTWAGILPKTAAFLRQSVPVVPTTHHDGDGAPAAAARTATREDATREDSRHDGLSPCSPSPRRHPDMDHRPDDAQPSRGPSRAPSSMPVSPSAARQRAVGQDMSTTDGFEAHTERDPRGQRGFDSDYDRSAAASRARTRQVGCGVPSPHTRRHHL
ncbi:unnamed protein product [Vitrella brassicaformis CCMP3155]|uniref:Uncharacterized protein n=1 Tax=Vitrella brassicaformis (strain CCMP3155) TaxID=1169540 RepID=A0A0G4EAV4_VITBC|nr:unnamed protein product [Vitrella brassicaformis CCMP3155]|eukprot:CEL92419.1 unnamed protein product [Vitrella brassicaformis CCMP3155]